ncbi:uncharacterized protein LOC113284372 [Papaver somniferum]|uniref:uncharacterized protein LOC113284372 n=1 Tax=Papaver somniferum TaxID=3469 RepID=UPI000E70357A|nr:uncharacterized protein LOC113284372 [Papaver somniferum]
MNSVKYLGEEFFYQQQEEKEEKIIIGSCNGSGSVVNAVSLFPSLISLTLRNMINIEEWVAPPAIHNSFPFIENLDISECQKLRSTPKSFFSLKELRLYSIGNSKSLSSIFSTTGGLTSLTFIIIDCYQNLYIPLGVLLRNITPNLQDLRINNFPKFQGFVEDDDLNNYNNKDGDDDDEKVTLSFSCPEINSNSNNRSNSLRSLTFTDCPVLTLLPDLRSFTSLRELTIWDCHKLKESIPYDLKTLTFLEDLGFDFTQSEYEYPEDPADKSLSILNRFEEDSDETICRYKK